MQRQKQSGWEHADRPQNKTLVRGLTVLSAIETLGQAKLTTIARETGLPKPTVSRLLQTLREQGYVRDLGPRQGYVTARLPKPARCPDDRSGLLALSKPFLDAVVAKIKFPTCLAIVDVPRVNFLLDNSTAPPFRLTDDVLRNCASLTGSAAGIAYLARLSDRKRREILKDCGADIDDVERVCAQALDQGFAFTNHDDLAPGLRAIAVSVQHANRTIGSITTHFVDDYVSDQQRTFQIYPELRKASEKLGECYVHSLACGQSPSPFMQAER